MDALSNSNLPQLNRLSGPRAADRQEILERQQGEGEPSEAPERDTYHETPRHENDLDEDEEQAEGRRQEDELLERHSLWTCPASALRLAEILKALLVHSRRPEVPYEFLALDTPTPFASSCCHGAVYFSRGLLQELAQSGVIFFAAHEMAHTELRHYASRRRRLEELRRAIPAAPGSAARQRFETAAVLAVRHQEEFEADHLAARWLDFPTGQAALEQLHGVCRQLSPRSLSRPTHPPFERRLARLASRESPPDPISYLWSLLEG